MKEVNIYLMTSCVGVKQREAWYISLMEYKTAKGPVTKHWIRKVENTTKNAVELEGLEVTLEALRIPCALSIYADSSYLERAFNQRWVDKWIENGWKNAKGSEIAHVEKWRKALILLKAHEFRICVKTDHEYGAWMKWILESIATSQKKEETECLVNLENLIPQRK